MPRFCFHSIKRLNKFKEIFILKSYNFYLGSFFQLGLSNLNSIVYSKFNNQWNIKIMYDNKSGN